MLAILYLFICCLAGRIIFRWAFHQGFNPSHSDNGWMMLLPAWFLTGTLVVTWITYILSCLASNFVDNPLYYANITAIFLFIILLIHHDNSMLYRNRIRELYRKLEYNVIISKPEIVFILACLILSIFLTYHSFNIDNEGMKIGFSVYSDFGPHISMIRSFSRGSNFPTCYPHYPDGTMRYHFMFQFLAGNLEFLGLRIDNAFNLISIASMVSFLMLLYCLAYSLTGNKWAGIITGVLCMFRSSAAFLLYLRDIIITGESITDIFERGEYTGRVHLEQWGLWNQNTYANQRHLAFALGFLLLFLILILPLVKKMIDKINVEGLKQQAYEFFTARDAWVIDDIKSPIYIGVMLGLLSFWNGAVVIAALIILFFTALFSKHRLSYLVAALIAILLSFIQANFFTGAGASIVEPKLYIGFLAPGQDVMGIVLYYMELMGIMPIVFIMGILSASKIQRSMAIAFLAPLVFATTVSLTPDIAVNHKYVVITVILLNISVGYYLIRLFSSVKMIKRLAAVMLLFFLTVTGMADIILFYNFNKNKVVFQNHDPLTAWVEKYSHPEEVFLTDACCLHPILLAGRRIFYGWPYYAWSAGYDTSHREAIVKEIYEGEDIDRVRKLVLNNHISYIVIDDDNRNSQVYSLNEEFFDNNFKIVYRNDDKNTKIYTAMEVIEDGQ